MQGYRTLIVFGLAAIVGLCALLGWVNIPADVVVALFAGVGVPIPAELAQYLVGRTGGAVMLVMGGAGIGLRLLTSTPAGVRLLPLLIALPLLGACAGTAPSEADDDVSGIRAFALEDLQTALALAEAGQDRLAVKCWARLIAIVGRDRPDRVAIKGAFSAYQSARNIRHRLESGVPDDIREACAPMTSESRGVLLRLLAIGRGAL